MKTMLFAAAALGGALLSAAPVIEKLDYPETVRAGEPFELSVTVSGTGDAPASCSFNGETRLIPPNLHNYAAGKLAAKYLKARSGWSGHGRKRLPYAALIPVPAGRQKLHGLGACFRPAPSVCAARRRS